MCLGSVPGSFGHMILYPGFSRIVPLYACYPGITINSMAFHSRRVLDWIVNYTVTHL